MNIVYLNGHYLTTEKAKVSVLDRGFLFSDGIYEVISVYNGKPFLAHKHIDRLNHSAQAIGLLQPFSQAQWLRIFSKLLKLNQIKTENKSLYLQMTRGVDSTRSLALPKSHLKPTVFVMLKELIQPDYSNLSKGFKVITREDIRWKLCHIKTTALLPNILMQQEALNEGANEVLLIRDKKIIEGASSNVFIAKSNVIYTPPLSSSLLGGTTRALVIELAQKNKLSLQEKQLTLTRLLNADEVWITSSSRDVMPISFVNDQKIANGKPGPLWKKMHSLFQTHKNSL
ncbi:MAG: aminotransferase class IV [Pseudomonadota bacterium]|nr:aminotransferase class IV [Gammaproteobacteria bacterium]MBU1629092.1 aminotransferase class IV [Gammaproteobacteria bacterium]MBU2545698.1 aminotransferase class IV [Gammaproteobacteria bacterium]